MCDIGHTWVATVEVRWSISASERVKALHARWPAYLLCAAPQRLMRRLLPVVIVAVVLVPTGCGGESHAHEASSHERQLHLEEERVQDTLAHRYEYE